MASIYYLRENQPSIRQHIADPRKDLGPMDFVRFSSPLGDNNQASAHLGPQGFHMALES